MKRVFNSTGRVHITRDRYTIRLIDDQTAGPRRFQADLSGITSMGLNPAARVFVEPYVRQSSMRFDFGRIGAMVPPADTRLTEIDRGEAVQFRIKVVDSSDQPGRLLATADQIRPQSDADGEHAKSILAIDEVDLGEGIVRLEVGCNESPVLLLNRNVPGLRARLLKDPVLRGSIFESAVRQVFRTILVDDVDESQEWVSDWRSFAEELLREQLPETPPDEPEASELIQRVVDAFNARQQWASLARPALVLLEEEYE